MIDIKELTFRYRKKEPLFSHLNLNIKSGNICGLLGRNGAGKTTLLRLISGLLFSQSGQCDVLGFNPKNRNPNFLEEIYFIPEEFYVPPMTITAYLKTYAIFYPNFDSKAFYQCLKEFDLPKNKNLMDMSYGQKKKFSISFAIATNCKLVILDEPTNGLDIPSKSQFRKLLAGAITEEKTFIISTHQVRDIEHLIDPIIIIDDGKIILDQNVESITEKLLFEMDASEAKLKDSLYYEKHFNSIQSVRTNEDNIESQINLEILFNAVISNKEQIITLFSEENKNEEQTI